MTELESLSITDIDLAALKEAGVVARVAKQAKVIKTGELTRKLNLKGILVTKGAREAIEAAGGSVSE